MPRVVEAVESVTGEIVHNAATGLRDTGRAQRLATRATERMNELLRRTGDSELTPEAVKLLLLACTVEAPSDRPTMKAIRQVCRFGDVDDDEGQEGEGGEGEDEAVLIGGATGVTATRINGVYDSVGVHNGRSLFRQRGDPGQWLRWVPSSGCWTVSSTADKDSNNALGICRCEELGLDDPRQAKTWRVHDGTLWTAQPAMACVSFIPPLLLGGVADERASLVNGTYDPVGVYGGKVLFQKRGDADWCLRWVSTCKIWIVSSTANELVNDDMGSCRCVDLDPPCCVSGAM